MSCSLPGNVAEALVGQEPLDPAAGLASGFGILGAIAVDGFGGRVGLALEARARELLGRLYRHHPGSAAHSLRVAGITMMMWRTAPGRLGTVEDALLGSLLHDVGKLRVPREILASPHRLSVEERVVMGSHAEAGAEILLDMGFPESIAAIARGHHERWTGGGYPSALPSRNLAPVVRAVAVADAFDAMTDPDRQFRPALGWPGALREVEACSGTHFDPMAAAILAECMSGRSSDDWTWCTAAPQIFPPVLALPAGSAALH